MAMIRTSQPKRAKQWTITKSKLIENNCMLACEQRIAFNPLTNSLKTTKMWANGLCFESV